MPAFWYISTIFINGDYLNGGGIPGINYFPIGKNERVAWGTTAGYGDISDLYLEKLNEN